MRRIPTHPITKRERDQLIQLRLEQDWSWDELAERIGMPTATVKKILQLGVETQERTSYKIRRWMLANAALLAQGELAGARS